MNLEEPVLEVKLNSMTEEIKNLKLIMQSIKQLLEEKQRMESSTGNKNTPTSDDP